MTSIWQKILGIGKQIDCLFKKLTTFVSNHLKFKGKFFLIEILAKQVFLNI